MKFANKNSPQNDASAALIGVRSTDRISAVRRFCMSPLFMWLCFFCAAVLMVLDHPVFASVFFLIVVSALLVICDDILATTLPFMLLCISVLPCYDSFDTFIKFVWLAPVPVAALLFHFIAYRRPAEFGDSFWGHVGVSVAVLCGGIGAIGAAEYFSGSSIYYVLMLGVGLLIAYLLMRSQIHDRADYDIREKLVTILIIAGIFAAFETFVLMLRAVQQLDLGLQQFIDIFLYPQSKLASLDSQDQMTFCIITQPSNNLSTFLMICLPATFYRAFKKNPSYIFLSLFLVAAMYLTKSRSGMLLGAAEFVLCIIVFSLLIKNRPLKYTLFGLGLLILIVGAVFGTYFLLNSDIISPEEARYKLVLRSIDDLRGNPIFGQGLGSRSNADLYPGKTGTMIWYHMMIPQIIGSMGIVGILGYGLQFFMRARVTLKKLNPYTVTFFMCYVGLFMMSQINPGEFCPIPYGLIAVLLFIMIENEPDRSVKAHRPTSQVHCSRS